jgi:C4-dicarboxylate-specific signal transduction histidine kinase
MMTNTPSVSETPACARKRSHLEQATVSSTTEAPANARMVGKAIESGAIEQEVLGLSWHKRRAPRVSRLGELVGSIVHEVNQPLAAIQLNAQTALRWLDGDPQNVVRARTLIERIVQDSGRTLDIVAHIRAMASGRAPQQTNLTLDEIIAEAMTFLQHELQSNDVIMSLDLTSSPSEINGNRSQLHQVIVNLVVNAIQALANTDTIPRKIAVRTSNLADELVCCTVEDSGPGIDPCHLPHLFEDVFTTRPTGMGMGLLISRSIVAVHGGGIRADNYSSLGGARFTLTLPGFLPCSAQNDACA